MLNVSLTPHRYKIEHDINHCDYFLVYLRQLSRWLIEVVINNHDRPDGPLFLCGLDGAKKINEVVKPRCEQTASFEKCEDALNHWKAYAEKFHLRKIDKHYKMRITVEVVTNALQTPPEAENLFDASRFWKMRVIDSVTLSSWDADKQE